MSVRDGAIRSMVSAPSFDPNQLDENFDADEILRDVDEKFEDEELGEEDMRELNFGNIHDENANFSDMASDLDTTEDMWQ